MSVDHMPYPNLSLVSSGCLCLSLYAQQESRMEPCRLAPEWPITMDGCALAIYPQQESGLEPCRLASERSITTLVSAYIATSW